MRVRENTLMQEIPTYDTWIKEKKFFLDLDGLLLA